MAGNPARVISTLEEYYRKLKNSLVENATREAGVFYQKHNRLPKIEETGYFMVTFLERTNENVEKYIKHLSFKGDSLQEVIETFLNSEPIFNGYTEYYQYMEKKMRE